MKILLIVSLITISVQAHAYSPTNWQEELIYRVTMGSAKDVSYILKRAPDPNITDSLGYPLLYIAATRNDDQALEVVKSLVDGGADINFAGSDSYYPILAAVQSENMPITRYLIEQGASYRARDASGYSLKLYGEQSTLPQLRKLVVEYVEQGMAADAALTSQGTLDELTHRLAWNACALQYYTFYYQSGQDQIDVKERQATLQKHQNIVAQSMQTLAGRFRVKNGILQELYATAKQGIFDELEGLISNRWRRKNGVGQSGDMNKRCDKHAKEFTAGKLDANYLLRRKKNSK